ncbi:MAG: hypothetical protein ABEJ43_01095 [Haloferacaceae archaeon]
MNPVWTARLLIWGGLTLLGAVVTGVTGFLVVRGPFLGGQALDPQPLLAAAGAFVVGIIVLTLGGSKLGRMVWS